MNTIALNTILFELSYIGFMCKINHSGKDTVTTIIQ